MKIEELEKIEFLGIFPNQYFDEVEFTKEYLLCCGIDKRIIFLKFPSYNVEWETIINKDRIKATKIINDSLFIVGDINGRCAILDIKNKKVIKILGFKKRIINIDFALKRNLFTIALEGEVHILDCEYGGKVFGNGKYLLGVERNSFKVYNTENWNEELILPIPNYYYLRDIDILKDNKYLLYSQIKCFGGADEIYIIDLKEGKYLKKIKLPNWPLSLAISKDNNYLAVATPKGIFIYSLSDIFP